MKQIYLFPFNVLHYSYDFPPPPPHPHWQSILFSLPFILLATTNFPYVAVKTMLSLQGVLAVSASGQMCTFSLMHQLANPQNIWSYETPYRIFKGKRKGENRETLSIFHNLLGLFWSERQFFSWLPTTYLLVKTKTNCCICVGDFNFPTLCLIHAIITWRGINEAAAGCSDVY